MTPRSPIDQVSFRAWSLASRLRQAVGTVLLISGALLLAPTSVPAGETCAEVPRQRLLDGCWRQQLEAQGFMIDGDLIVEFVRNTSGGRVRNGAAAWRSTIGVTIDLDRIHGLSGSRFRVSGAWNEGDSLGADIETIFNPIEIYGLRGSRLWELYWGQSLAGGEVDFKIGRHSPADHFNVQPITFDFTNLGFYGLSMLFNDFAFRSRPVGMWGVSADIRPEASPFYFKAGVFSGAPRDLQRTDAHGLDFTFDLAESTLALGEIGVRTDLLHGLPGTYRIGAFHNTARLTSFENPTRSKRGNTNFYVSGEQAFYREPGSQTQGLDWFFLFNAPADKDVNLVESYITGGLVYTGLFEGRDADRTYVGFAHAELNDAVTTLTEEIFHGLAIAPNQPHESVLEIGHAVQLTPFWSVTPGVQFIFNPGLTDDVDNAVVLGAQTALTF